MESNGVKDSLTDLRTGDD